MSPFGVNTSGLCDLDQRAAPIENIGLVIGTVKSVAMVHLQLEMAARMFGRGGLPILVVNDGDTETEWSADSLRKICDDYGADFYAGPHIGHATGDLRVFVKGLEWSEDRNVQILVKLSRRYVPLVPWRHKLLCLASANQQCAVFARRNCDRADGLFRTDCIALRVRKWKNELVSTIFPEAIKRNNKSTCVESIILSITRSIGGWEWWDLVGEDMHRPYAQALQWRGILPCHYGDTSRWLGLPYGDGDFMDATGSASISDIVVDDRPRTEATHMRVVEDPAMAAA